MERCSSTSVSSRIARLHLRNMYYYKTNLFATRSHFHNCSACSMGYVPNKQARTLGDHHQKNIFMFTTFAYINTYPYTHTLTNHIHYTCSTIHTTHMRVAHSSDGATRLSRRRCTVAVVVGEATHVNAYYNSYMFAGAPPFSLSIMMHSKPTMHTHSNMGRMGKLSQTRRTRTRTHSSRPTAANIHCHRHHLPHPHFTLSDVCALACARTSQQQQHTSRAFRRWTRVCVQKVHSNDI